MYRLQHTATHCNTLQHTAIHCHTLPYTATRGNTLQHIATCCNTMHHHATPCNTLQMGDVTKTILVANKFKMNYLQRRREAIQFTTGNKQLTHSAHAEVCCSVLPYVAVYCRVVQFVAMSVRGDTFDCWQQYVCAPRAGSCVLYCVAVCYRVVQCIRASL